MDHINGNKPRVRMAYTLNNFQPVLCTMLSDQPYFYMDENISEDDELAEMERAINNLEHDIADLNQKINTYDKMSEKFMSAGASVLDEFLENAERMTVEHIERISSTEFLKDVLATLAKSRMAASLMALCDTHGVAIKTSHQVTTATFDVDAKAVLINPTLNKVDAVLVTLRELRRHFQFRSGALLHPLTFNPDHGILINRAQRADLAVAMVRGAWELQLAGEKDIWVRVENSSMGDLGRALAREAFLDFRTLNNGLASSAVFETWFLSERARAEDKKLIQAMLADYQGYVFGSDQISKTVSVELLSALGEQPFGKNYLSPYAQMIMTDPVFTEVRDRSNANFLWFIKFERSFKETEQELQSGEDAPSSDVLSGDLHKSLGTRKHEADASGLFRLSESKKQPLENSGSSDNVIHVAFGQFKNTKGEAV